MNTHKTFTTSYHPQTDGLCERFNGTPVQCISMYCDSSQRNWDEHLNAILFAYKTAPSEVLGESPFFLLYGCDPNLPCDPALLPPREMTASVAEHWAHVVENIEIAHRIALENTQRPQQRMKDLHDRTADPTKFQLGERVWVFTHRVLRGLSKKLAHLWHGPYRIVEFLSPVHCILCTTDNRRISTTVHVSQHKRYVDPNDQSTRQPPVDIDEPFLSVSDLPSDSFLPLSSEQIQPSSSADSDPALAAHNELVLPISDSVQPITASSNSPSVDVYRSTGPLSLPTIPEAEEDPADEPADMSDSAVYQAEWIVRHRIHDGQPQFLIKWAGFPASFNTWEPRENILDQRLFRNYLKAFPAARRMLNDDPDF